MWNRVLLIVVCVVSLGWISFVGWDIFNKTDRLDPILIFSQQDKRVLIINRTDEFPSIHSSFTFPETISDLTEQLIQTPRNERIFVSEIRPVLLVESPNYWDEKSVLLYLNRKKISYEKKGNHLFIQSFQVKFKYHYLLIAPSNFEKISHPAHKMMAWDKNSTATIIENIFTSNEKRTDIYREENGQIIYKTSYENHQKSEKVDDFRLFAAQLPSQLSNYHFVERNYAIANHLLDTNSPALDWINRGFVRFSYDGTIVYMTDSKIGEDPLNTLNTMFGKDTMIFQENEAIRNIALTTSFPSQTRKGFYFSRVGDKSIFSENLNVNKKIVADYELGHTLLLNPSKSNRIFGQLPDKVVERVVNSKEEYAVSVYRQLKMKYIIQNSFLDSIADESTPSVQNPPLVIPIEGKIIEVLGRGNQQYFLTSTHKLYAVNNGKIGWKYQLEGALVGSVKLLDDASGKKILLLNTAKKVYIFNERGGSWVDETRLPQGDFLNEVNLYHWKGISYLIFESQAGRIRVVPLDGKSTARTIQHSLGSPLNKILFFEQNGKPIGLAFNASHSETINLSNYKLLKKRNGFPLNFKEFSHNGEIGFVGFEGGKLLFFDYTGENQTVDVFQNPSHLKVLHIDNKDYITFMSANKLVVYSANLKQITAFNLPENGIQDYDVCLVNGAWMAGFIDGLENKAFVVNDKNQILSKEVEAKNYLFMSVSKNTLNMLTVGNGYAVQYYNLLQPKK